MIDVCVLEKGRRKKESCYFFGAKLYLTLQNRSFGQMEKLSFRGN